jgi:KDO2-lipid IV(A) lauroyltransferase
MSVLHIATTQIIFGFASMLGLMPWPWAQRTADVIGRVWYLLDKRHRNVALNNLAKAYAEEKTTPEIRAIARASFEQIARIPFEIGWSLRCDLAETMRHCRFHGLNHLRQAHAKGRGVLVLTLHIGNWELLPMSFISQGFNVSLVYRPLDFGPADQFFLQYRSRFGGNPIPKKKSMRKLLHALRRQECVGLLLDQDSGLTAGVFADFFGQPACTNKGMALLTLKTQAPVISACLVRRGLGFDIHIGPEIPLIRNDDKDKEVQINTQQYNKALEDIIRRHPEQWLWVHRRWKNRPPKEAHQH